MKVSTITLILFINVTSVFSMDRSQPTKNKQRITRIANGQPLDQDNYSYVVGLKIGNSDGHINFCTGTLLSPFFVLTAAHCIENTIFEEVIFITYFYVNRKLDYFT